MPSWKLFPEKKDPTAERIKAEKAALQRMKKAEDAASLAKKKPVTLATPARYGLPGNPHDKLVQDLIDGLKDGTITLRSIDVRRTASKPYIDMVIEAIQMDTTTPTVPQKLHAGPTGATGPPGNPGVTGATGPAGAQLIPPGGFNAAQAAAAVSAVASAMTSVSSTMAASSSMLSKVAALPGAKTYGLKLSTSEEPVVGYRDFSLTQGLFGYALQSRNGAVWPARKKMRGLCNGNPFANHDVPDPGCQCGIYAYDKPDNPSLQSSPGKLWGEIAMWGEVLVCDTGYRAEFAYPTALFLLNPASPNNRITRAVQHVKEELEDTYGVPVFILAERASKTASDLMQEILQRELGDILKEDS